MSVALSLRFLYKKLLFLNVVLLIWRWNKGTMVFTNVAVVNLGSKKLNHNNAN